MADQMKGQPLQFKQDLENIGITHKTETYAQPLEDGQGDELASGTSL